MKKIISVLLAVVMLLGALPVFADQENSAKMQEVLLLVKEKISVPEELSEFSGGMSDYGEEETYHFEWFSPDYKKTISVSCDAMGRIASYHQDTVSMSEERISKVSKAELVAYALEFLEKTVPETFVSDKDGLVFDEDSYRALGNLGYNIGFQRERNGIPVKDNAAHVYLFVVDDEIHLRSMDVRFAYDATFGEEKPDLENYQEKYQELFPVEMIYRNEYNPYAKGKENRYTPRLIYRIKDDKAGYMNSVTGEVMTEDPWDDKWRAPEAAEDSAVNMGAAGGGSLTPQEQKELKEIEGLKSEEEIEKSVKDLPYLDFPDRLERDRSSLSKDEQGNYFLRMNYSYEDESEYQYLDICANAKTGEIVEIYTDSNDYPEEKTLTDAQRKSGEKKITEFLNAVAKEKFAQTTMQSEWENRTMINRRYLRLVNDVPFVDNGILVRFDGVTNTIKGYSLNFTRGEFTDPKDAMGEAEAYGRILEYAPILPVYIKSDGVYQKAFTLSESYISIDAVSGESNQRGTDHNYQYSDIQGHWVQEIATKLAENQLGLPGGKLEPEQEITQGEFLQILAAAVMGSYYGDYTEEELYERLIRGEYLTEEEKAPKSPIKREDAFVYMIRMEELERVAKLNDIYKITYGDQEELTPEKLGYAAILSGFGVICGDGGNLRPQDALTRAEALAMVYKYLLFM